MGETHSPEEAAGILGMTVDDVNRYREQAINILRHNKNTQDLVSKADPEKDLIEEFQQLIAAESKNPPTRSAGGDQLGR